MTYEAWRISHQSSEQAARAAYAECGQLRAKIEQMERQEPVASIYIDGKGDREFDDWKCALPVGRSLLYTLPGAQGEKK